MAKNKKEQPTKPHEKPISLEPLTPEEVLKALLSTPTPKNSEKPKK